MMLVVALCVLSLSSISCFVPPEEKVSHNTLKCVTKIINEYYGSETVTFNIHESQEEDEILQAIHYENAVSTVTKQFWMKFNYMHRAYVLVYMNVRTAIEYFPDLTKEFFYKPNGRFLIILTDSKENDLKKLFNMLLYYHINNVIVVNATDDDPSIFTYNPFENFGCGKHYDRIIELGKCSKADAHNLYPYKYVTGLRKCTFVLISSHWPPFSIIHENFTHPSHRLDLGLEPYIIHTLGNMFGFNLRYTFSDEKEGFPRIKTNAVASGSLSLLQENKVDILVGGMLLTDRRAAALGYLYGHLTYTDDVRYVVKKASREPFWKNIYLEFDWTVWLILAFFLIFYSFLMIKMIRTEDKGNVILKLLDCFLLHGFNCSRYTSIVKYVLILWVWFAYLINSFYTTSLISINAHPVKQYQISSEKDIHSFKLRPCLSKVMRGYYEEHNNETRQNCSTLPESISTVVKTNSFYTLSLNALFLYNSRAFYDEYGVTQTYTLKDPYSKVINTAYTYKGFPLHLNLSLGMLRITEAGITKKVLADLYYVKTLKSHYRAKTYEPQLVVPWYLFTFGVVISSIAFVVEITYKRKT